MVRLFTFSRSKKTDKKKSRTDLPEEQVEDEDVQKEHKMRFRFKRPTELLKKMNVNLMSKMEELRVLPVSYTNDDIGSFFYDELEFFNTTESSPLFKYFYLDIVDKSQTLPIILLNKDYILDSLLEKYQDKYYQPICSKLLVALVRDCGQEIQELFIEKVIPTVAVTIKVVDVASVEVGFRVFASALKFLMKEILKRPILFIKPFLSSMIKIKNAYIRKFTTECVIFIISRIKQKDEVNTVMSNIFDLSLEDLGITDKGLVMSQNYEDFKATLLFMVLKGDQGSISPAGRDLQDYIAQLLSTSSLETQFFKKSFNLLIENEYRFFRARNANAPVKIGEVVYLEDFLISIYESNPISIKLSCNLLSILTEILLFGSGQRFSQRFTDLSEKLVKKRNPELIEEGLIFLSKYLIVKKSDHHFCQLLAESDLTLDQVHCFMNNLFKKSTFKRTKIHSEFKKRIIEFQAEIAAPVLAQSITESILEIMMKGLTQAITGEDEDMITRSNVVLLACSYIETNLSTFKLSLPAKVYSSMKQQFSKSSLDLASGELEESDDRAVYLLSIARLIRMTQNFDDDTSAAKVAQNLITAIESMPTIKNADINTCDEHIEINKIDYPGYLLSFQSISVNYSLRSDIEFAVLFACELIQTVLTHPNAGEKEVQDRKSVV